MIAGSTREARRPISAGAVSLRIAELSSVADREAVALHPFIPRAKRRVRAIRCCLGPSKGQGSGPPPELANAAAIEPD
jgi:hypothetical protein